MRNLIKIGIVVVLSGFFSMANAQQASNLDELLEIVRQGKINETEEYRQREAEFRGAKDRQAGLLAEAEASQRAEERRSDNLEAQFAANDEQLATLEQEFTNELGALKEVLGVLQLVSGDTRSRFEGSLTSTQFQGREEFITTLIEKTSSGTQLPSIEEIERLWYEVQREMTEQGRVVTFDRAVKMRDGSEAVVPVTRVGVFNIAMDGKYLKYEQGLVAELDSQPQARFAESTSELQNATSGFAAFGLDPSRGSILALLIQQPNLEERIEQGGTIGNLILAVGALGLLLFLERVVFLSIASSKVKAQIRSDTINENNPLGRVLAVHEANRHADVETLELKIDEAILKEMPPLERFLTMIKLIFVALPMLFLHSLVNGMSQRVVHTIEEQSAGIIAVHAEQHNKGA